MSFSLLPSRYMVSSRQTDEARVARQMYLALVSFRVDAVSDARSFSGYPSSSGEEPAARGHDRQRHKRAADQVFSSLPTSAATC